MSPHKNLLHRDVILATILTFIILWILKLVIVNTKYLDPISQALGDFQFTDMYYSQFQKQKIEIDTNIVIVNIGDGDRQALAQQIAIVQSFKPKVIGLDVTFHSQKDPHVDSLLKAILHSTIPIIQTSNIVYKDENHQHSLFSVETSNAYFEKGADEGYGNFLAEEGQAVRYYSPIINQGKKKYNAFTTKIIERYDNDAYAQLLKRNKKTEIINYQTNTYLKLDVSDVFSGADLSFLENKIVLMGYMGPSLSQIVFEDNHLTPLNKSYGGHAIPDKYGVEIHANIISMVLRNSYITDVPKWFTYILAFLVCVAHMYAFIYLYVKQHRWFHLGAKIIQLISFFILIFFSLLIYHYFKLKLEPSYILAGVLISCDALYFYEEFVELLRNRLQFKSYFHKTH